MRIWTHPANVCDSLKVIAREKPGTPPERRHLASRVIAFPVFERYADAIPEWISAIGNGKSGKTVMTRIAKEMRCVANKAGRVQSARYNNLASFLLHAADAVEAAEWDGARYLLMTALALMNARPVPLGERWPGLATAEDNRWVRQFPETRVVDAATGIVTG